LGEECGKSFGCFHKLLGNASNHLYQKIQTMKSMYLKEFKLLPSLLLLVILPMIATDIYLPVVPQMGREFEAAGSGLANTLSAYMLGYSLSLLAAGALQDVYGRRVVAIIGLTIFFLSSIGCFFAATVDQLIIWRFFQAFGEVAAL
jgi:DHA1 family bicyclomycin/chloramphenicol resistance-like MFS transporter